MYTFIIHCTIFLYSHWLRLCVFRRRQSKSLICQGQILNLTNTTFICQGQNLILTNKCRICHVHTVPAYFVGGISHESKKELCIFVLKWLCFISWEMNNKRIIEFGFRKISELFRPRSAKLKSCRDKIFVDLY